MSVKTIGEEAKGQGKLIIFLAAGITAFFGLVPLNPLILIICVFLALTGYLLYKNTTVGIILDLIISVLAIIFFAATGSVEQWWKWAAALFVCFSFWIELKRYVPILKGTKNWGDLDWIDEDDDPEEAPPEPLISIVLLQRQARGLDPVILQEILSEAWGGSYSDDSKTHFVAGEDPVHFVRSDQGMWLIHNHAEPYGPPEEMAESVSELRLRSAVAEHRAWMAVDLIAPENEELPLDTFYPYIFRLIKDLANEDTLVIYRPESGSANIWDEEVAESLGSDNPLEAFKAPTNPSVLQMADDDPRMLAAVKEATDSFHLFREHWEKRREDGHYSVKARITREDNTEFIWVEVSGLEPEFIHGHLANEPVNLPGLKIGDQVEIPLSDLNDWVVIADEESEPLGLYTVKVIQEAHS